MTLHPAVAPFAPLLGTWRGKGAGEYPSIAPFEYTEELVFEAVHPSKPVIAYRHKTARCLDGSPLHSETGFLRPGVVCHWAVSQSTGVAEASVGSWAPDEGVLLLSSSSLGGADKVVAVERQYTVRDGQLSYVISMATTSSPLLPHLRASLTRDTC